MKNVTMADIETVAVREDEEKRKLSHGDVTPSKRKHNTFKPIGIEKDILTVDPVPGFEDRWVLDNPPGNITRKLRMGYEFVIDDTTEVGDVSVDGHRVPGGVVCKYGDPRHKTLQYLMRIPKELYDEHQKKKQVVVDEINNELYRKAPGEYTGKESKVESGLAIHTKD